MAATPSEGSGRHSCALTSLLGGASFFFDRGGVYGAVLVTIQDSWTSRLFSRMALRAIHDNIFVNIAAKREVNKRKSHPTGGYAISSTCDPIPSAWRKRIPTHASALHGSGGRASPSMGRFPFFRLGLHVEIPAVTRRSVANSDANSDITSDFSQNAHLVVRASPLSTSAP